MSGVTDILITIIFYDKLQLNILIMITCSQIAILREYSVHTMEEVSHFPMLLIAMLYTQLENISCH